MYEKKKMEPNAKWIGRCEIAQRPKRNKVEPKCIWDVFDEEFEKSRRIDERLRDPRTKR